jgi:hypothetical protein
LYFIGVAGYNWNHKSTVGQTMSIQEKLEIISRRNELRQQAHLPLLSVASEARAMKQLEINQVFRNWEAPRRPAVFAEVLQRHREKLNNPSWRPGAISGQGLSCETDAILREQYLKVKA